MMRLICLFAFLLGMAVPASAAPLIVRVVDSAGRPVPNAVVTARLAGARPAQAAGAYTVSQHDLMFDPFVLVVPVGATVKFPNNDDTRHHVYSFSPAKKFELKLFARDQTRSVRFDKPGVVAIGCNIHDGMSAFLFVTGEPLAARTDQRGIATIADVPPGAGTLSVWHPYLRSATNSASWPLGASQRRINLNVRLRSAPVRAGSGY